MAEATSATEKAVAEGQPSGAPSPGQPGAQGQPTEAQQAEAARVDGEQQVNPADGTPLVSEEQQAQYEEDQRARVATGYNEPIGREANPEFGGESFGYGQPPTK